MSPRTSTIKWRTSTVRPEGGRKIVRSVFAFVNHVVVVDIIFASVRSLLHLTFVDAMQVEAYKLRPKRAACAGCSSSHHCFVIVTRTSNNSRNNHKNQHNYFMVTCTRIQENDRAKNQQLQLAVNAAYLHFREYTNDFSKDNQAHICLQFPPFVVSEKLS